MAGNNEAKVRFTAETSDFTQAIKEANSEMSTLRAEMKLNDAQFQNTGNETEYLQQKTQLLEAQLQANADKQEALTDKLEVAKEIYGEDSEEVAKLERQLIYTQTSEEKLKGQLEATNQGFTDQSQAAEDAGSAVDDMANILMNAGIVSTVMEIADQVYELAGAFSEANAAIVEGTGASGDALNELNEAAHSAFGQIADADQDLAGVSDILAELNTRFGITGKDAENMTVKVANFAQHTGTDGTKAVDSMANVMNRWGLSMEDADGLLDDLTTANQSCQLSVDDLTGYLAENSIQFQELGYDTSDALAMLISLSDGGANVSSVMMGMKKAVGNLSGATNDVPGAFQDAIKAIADCDSVSEALQAQVGNTGLTVEKVFGAKAAQELASNVQSGNFNIDKWTKTLKNNQGALADTTENATTMQDAWAQATNSVSLALGDTLGTAVEDVVIKISEVITKVSEVIRKSPVLQAVIVGVATALGILAAALGVSALIRMVTTAWGALNAVMMLNPIFLIVTAIAALVAGLMFAYKRCKTFREVVNKAFSGIKKVVVTVLNVLKKVFTTVWEAIKKVVVTVWNTIKNTVLTVINVIRTVITTVFNIIKGVVTVVWNGIKLAIVTPIKAAATVVKTVINGIKNVISAVWNAIKGVTSRVWNAIKNAISTPIRAAVSVVRSVVSKIKSFLNFSGLGSTIKSMFSKIGKFISDPIGTAKDKIKSIIKKLKNFFPFNLGKLFKFQLPNIFKRTGKKKGSFAFGVNWTNYDAKNAAGAVFKAPTILPSVNGVRHLVGEAGPEAIAPISVLQGYVGAAVQQYMPQPIDYSLMAEVFANACAKMGITIELNGREFGRAVREVV